jgi:glycosyltransferase involved in cell wall biosynthesis
MDDPKAIGALSPPLVSVVVPTLNRPEYLGIALESALHQSLRNIEIIVQDNAGDVDPGDVVRRFGDPRVRFYRNAGRLTQTENIISACARAGGKYIAILGDDDLWHREFLATLVRPLEQDDTIVVAFSDHGIIDSTGREDRAMSDKVTRRFQRHALRPGRHRPFAEIALVYRSICMVSGAVLRRAAIDWHDVPLEAHFGVDLYLSYLAARTGGACHYTPRRLAHYRYHPQALGSSVRRPDQRLANAQDSMVYWHCFRDDGTLARNRRYFEMKLGMNALVIVTSLWRCGKSRQALDQLRRYWRDGLIRPRIFLDHLIYALRLRRASA